MYEIRNCKDLKDQPYEMPSLGESRLVYVVDVGVCKSDGDGQEELPPDLARDFLVQTPLESRRHL